MKEETKINIWQGVRVNVDSLRKVIKEINDFSLVNLAESALEDLSVAFLYVILSGNPSMHLGALAIDNLLTKYEILNTKIKNELFDSSVIIKDALSSIIVNNSDENIQNIKKEFENIKNFQDRCNVVITNEALSRKRNKIKEEDRFHYFNPDQDNATEYWFMNQLDEAKLKISLEKKKCEINARNNPEYEKKIKELENKL